MRVFALLLLVGACGAPPAKPPIAWTTTVRASNPLVGRTYDARRRMFVTFEKAEYAETQTPYVFLGEKHDNPDHHRLQAKALHWAELFNHLVAVVFEMIDIDLQPKIDAYFATRHANVDGLRDVLDWDTRGWPPWPR